MRGKFPDLKDEELDEADLFYGGPAPEALTSKLQKKYQVTKDQFDYYFKHGQMDDISRSFELHLVQVCFYIC